MSTKRSNVLTWRRVLVDRGVALALAVLVAYMWLAPAHIVDGDNAELSALGLHGGAAHPSGYPAYLLWLRVMQWLPGESPAHTAALATAILGALGAWALFGACRAWGARVSAATIAVSVFAAAPAVLRIATEAEVFALNNLVVALVLWLAAEAGPRRGWSRAALLGLVAGVGLANHMTCALVAPVGLHGVVRGLRESTRPRVLGALVVVGAFAIGLAPYLYLLVTPETPLSWGEVDSVSGLVAHVLRRDYGGATAFLPVGDPPGALAQWRALASTLGRGWLVIGALAGVAMLGVGATRRAGDRVAWAMLALSFVLAGPVLAVRYNIAPTGLGLYVLHRFHVLPLLLLAPAVAVALDRIADRVPSRARIALALVALPLGLGLSLPGLARAEVPAVEQYARNVLGAMPPGAVVLIGSDAEYFAMMYVQSAQGVRPDVTVIAPPLTVLPWYRARMARRGVALAPQGLVATVVALASAHRPVFVEPARVDLASTLPWVPYATLLRVLAHDTPPRSPDQTFADNVAAYSGFVIPYPQPGLDDEFATAIHRRYAGTWNAVGRRLAASGQRELAARAFGFATELGPR